MTGSTDPAGRTAATPEVPHEGPITLINSFVVDADRDEAFTALWAETSAFFRTQPGFVRLRLHRALSPNATYRYVNVATWASAAQHAEAHAQERFLELVGRPAWREFPSSPALYELVAEYEESRR